MNNETKHARFDSFGDCRCPEPPDSAAPELKRAWEAQYKRVINEIRASIGD
jgi:hypothetical protein